MNLLGHPISYEYDQIHSLQRSTSSHILSFTRQRIIFSEFSKKNTDYKHFLEGIVAKKAQIIMNDMMISKAWVA